MKKKNPPKSINRLKQDKEINRRKCHKYILEKKYKIDINIYNNIFIKQCGRCAICKKHQNNLRNALSVDHKHETNKIRGLLCSKCNLLLGFANDNIKILKNAIIYLNENE